MSGSSHADKPKPNRRTAIQWILLVVLAVLFLLSGYFGGSALLLIFYVPTPLVFAYVTYLGLRIRNGFVVQPYRNQALGTATIAAYLAAATLISLFLPAPANGGYGTVLSWALTNLAGDVPFLLWIDTTARVARKSDPYERDTLDWSKLRYVLFASVVVFAALGMLMAPIVIASFGSYVPSVSLLANIVGNIPFYAPLLAGVSVLSLEAIRSRDKTLRKHILWLALGCASFGISFVVTLTYTLLVPSASGGQYTPFVFATYIVAYYFIAYCLYKSARSLAPHTSRLEA